MKLQQPPVKDKIDSFAWQEWFRILRDQVQAMATSISWSIINFAGSNITDIQTRLHNQLQSIQGGQAAEYYHLKASEYASLSAEVTKTTNYTASAADGLINVDATSGSFTITLPTVVSGKVYNIVKTTSPNRVTVSTTTLGDIWMDSQWTVLTVRGTTNGWVVI